MLRQDIAMAIDATPDQIQSEINTSAATSLELLNTYLPADEPVAHITSASPASDGPTNSVLAITKHRLIFVAPAPQVVGWRLASITRSQAYINYFIVHGDAGDYTLGLARGPWADSFELLVKRASAIAVLEGR